MRELKKLDTAVAAQLSAIADHLSKRAGVKIEAADLRGVRSAGGKTTGKFKFAGQTRSFTITDRDTEIL